MHRDFHIAFSGDADIDFLKGMIPHLQGAIDMAKVVLAEGKAPAAKKLATDIIKAREGEIAMMKDWLHKKGVHSPHGSRTAPRDKDAGHFRHRQSLPSAARPVTMA